MRRLIWGVRSEEKATAVHARNGYVAAGIPAKVITITDKSYEEIG